MTQNTPILRSPRDVELLLKHEVYYGNQNSLNQILKKIRLADFKNFIESKRKTKKIDKKISYSVYEVKLFLQCNEIQAAIIVDYFNNFEKRVAEIARRTGGEDA